ncbi:MAG: hypothetical protein ABSD41_01290 [Candidatus Bathyarchaeia archaeon]
MNCTILIFTPKLREAMWSAGKLIMFELPDLVLVEIPIEMHGIVRGFLDFDRSLDQFWLDYERATGLAGPFVRAARYSWDHFLLELRKAKLVKPELKVACYGSVEDEKDRTRLSEKLLALELRSKISRIDVKEWRGYLAEELLSSQSTFKSAYDRLIGSLRGGLRKAVLWCGSASPIVNVLRKNGCPLQVHYVLTYLKPPLVALLAVARIRGLDNITDREIETGVKMHLQYLDFVISGENLDAAHRRWEDMVRLTVVRCI